MDNQVLKHVLEAVILASDGPVRPDHLERIVEQPGEVVESVLTELAGDYEKRGINLVKVAGGYQFLTAPRFHPYIARMKESDRRLSLSTAAMETLAIIAYRQPITAQEAAALRGVQTVSNILRNLQSLDLVKVSGRKDVIGRPMLYRTTGNFLELFGLDSLRDLPTLEEMGIVEE